METLKNYYETCIKTDTMPNFEDLDECNINSMKRSFGFAAFKFEKSTSILKHSMLLSAAQITRAIKSVNKRLEFDKQLSNLRDITGGIGYNSEIPELIGWYRNEYVIRPERYPGDEIVIKLIIKNLSNGYCIKILEALKNSKEQLKADLFIIYKQRCGIRKTYTLKQLSDELKK